MEEILASIRKIIADDQALFAGGEELPAEGPQLAPEHPSQAEEGLETANGHAPEPGQGFSLSKLAGADLEPPLVSPATDASVAAAFNALVASRFIRNSDVVMALTRELLRPMLTAWLDANLPPLVERLVRAEIERVSREE